jgi:hypothetical protein
LKSDKGIVLLAVQQDAASLRYASDLLKEDKDVLFQAASQNVHWALCFASNSLKSNDEILIQTLEQNTKFKKIQSHDFKLNIIEALRGDIIRLGCLPPKLLDDSEIVLAGLSKDHSVFEFISNRLKDNRDISVEALRSNSKCFKYVSDRLKDDFEMALSAVKDWYGNFEFVSERLKDEKEIATAAVNRAGNYLQYASSRLKDDKDLVLLAIKENVYAFVYASNRLKDDVEFVLEACKSANNYNLHRVLKFASDRVRKSKEICFERERVDDIYWRITDREENIATIIELVLEGRL